MENQSLRTVFNWVVQFIDPIKAARALHSLGWYLRDWYRYVHLASAEPIRLVDSWPQLHDRMAKTPFDSHYFWTSGWAMRRILTNRPLYHVDIGSQIMFVNLLSAVLPVTFVDYRPLSAHMDGLTSCCGDILKLPFANESVKSLSCLHVVEHIGLGRYGDSLNPLGTHQACTELQRVLAPGGSLYFALPVGKPRVCFNAHRVHAPQTIVEYLKDLELVEFSGVQDDGSFVERVRINEFSGSRYACGLFCFRKR